MDRRLSAARVLACFMVVQLHVSAELFNRPGPGWWAGNVIDSLTRSCVPLFFMVAGATMLRRDEPLGTFFRKRVLRVLPPLLLWSLFYLWWLWHNGGAGPATWPLAILQGPTMFHLWYFYALVGVYAALPILRKFYLHSSRRDHLLVLGGWLLAASLLPTAQNLLFARHCEGYIAFPRLNDVYHLAWFGGYVGYVLLGAIAFDRPAPARAGWAAFLGGSLATMAGNWWLARQFGTSCEFFMVYLSPFVVAAAWGLFTVLLSLGEGAPPRWLAALSDCTLGIYGLHVIVIGPVLQRFGWSPLAGNPWLNPVAYALAAFAVCFVVIYALRLPPPLRRLF
jgi:surface polysaccharide O-acyltransferase-like enzyme